MGQQPSAFVTSVHYDPPTKLPSGVGLAVEYGPGPRTARVYIDLPQPLGSHMPTEEGLVPLLRQLGETLLRISDTPLSIHALHLLRN
jgi:hypothetical protein